MKKLLVLTALAAVVGLLMTLGGNQAQAGDVSCGDILTSDTVLHEDLACGTTTPGLTITADDITLNCDGHTITGIGGVGIFLDGVDGVTVKNCHVTGFGNNFLLDDSDDNTLKANTSAGNISTAGFFLLDSFGNTIKGNMATGGVTGGLSRGFVFDGSSDNVVKGNTATGNAFRGFGFLSGSSDNTVKGNTSTGNGSAGFIFASGSAGNEIKGNTANGNAFEGFAMFSSVNTLKGNTANDNGTYGIRDTTGPANAYIGNTCSGNTTAPSLPAGLC